MATLRPVEERDARDITIRLNPSIVFKQDAQIRKVVGRHDFHMVDNPDYHPPITAQAQNGKVLFFLGTPENSQSRSASREMSVKDVPAYIVEELTKRPMKVREPRPTVIEVKIATVGDVEVTTAEELQTDGDSVTIAPVAPDLTMHRAGKPRVQAEALVS